MFVQLFRQQAIIILVDEDWYDVTRGYFSLFNLISMKTFWKHRVAFAEMVKIDLTVYKAANRHGIIKEEICWKQLFSEFNFVDFVDDQCSRYE